MSDGCSGPTIVGDCLFSYCCVRHDEKYYYGGSWNDRLNADVELYSCIKNAGYVVMALMYYYAVRVWGSPYFSPLNKHAWSFGNSYYAYRVKPFNGRRKYKGK